MNQEISVWETCRCNIRVNNSKEKIWQYTRICLSIRVSIHHSSLLIQSSSVLSCESEMTLGIALLTLRAHPVEPKPSSEQRRARRSHSRWTTGASATANESFSDASGARCSRRSHVHPAVSCSANSAVPSAGSDLLSASSGSPSRALSISATRYTSDVTRRRTATNASGPCERSPRASK